MNNTSSQSALRMRQVHLDFHTSPHIHGVGADWDAADFVKTLTEARVNSINIFAKCHHGMNYYPTKIGPVHPHLTFDLLGAQIEACQGAGIECPIYVSVGFEVSAAERHPEWRQVGIDGKLVGHAPVDVGTASGGWPWLCVNNGYADELVAQTEELMTLYPSFDGFWYDILMVGKDACACVNCLREMREMGLDAANAAHRAQHNNLVMRRFMERVSGVIRARKADAHLYYNCWPWTEMRREAANYSQLEIESLPTGGWGYGFYPLWARHARTWGLPVLGMTGRFHRSWADWGGLKDANALRFECGTIVAAGGAVCVGDQMHPSGRLNSAVYEVIGEAFADVETVEEYCVNAVAAAQVGLLLPQGEAAESGSMSEVSMDGVQGAAKMLLELHHQFDVILPNADFGQYELIVIPDACAPDGELVEKLKAFVANGGKLLLSHVALRNGDGFAMGETLGVDFVGMAESVPDYFQVTDESLLAPTVRRGFDYCLYEGPSVKVAPRAGTTTLAVAHETYFNRTWEHFSSHGFTPPLPERADYPAVTQAGNVVYCYGPVFSAYQKWGNLTFRALVGKCLERLLPEPLIQTDAPATAEVSLLKQGERAVVHLVNYHAQRRATPHIEALEAPVPLRDVRLTVRGLGHITRARAIRAGVDLPLTANGDAVTVTVPRVDAHEVVVLE